MADYFTHVSFEVKCEGESKERLLNLSMIADTELENAGESPLCAMFEDQETGVWIHDDAGNVNIDALCALLSTWLGTEPEPDIPIAFEWAFTCSKPRLDAFGGGAALVYSDDVKYMNTFQWLEENAIPPKEKEVPFSR